MDGIFSDSSFPSQIGCQLDGNISVSFSSDSSSSSTETLNAPDSNYSSEDKDESFASPADLSVKNLLNNSSNLPVELDIQKASRSENASSLPLTAVLNARSLYQKCDNFKTFINELGIELAIVSETWERERESLENLLKMENHKIISYKRQKVKASKQPGGGCALIYCENRFNVSQLEVPVPRGVEAVWALLKPKKENKRVKKIAVCSLYVSPTSKFKTKTIDHIVETIHLLRSQHDNEISFLLAGDLNQLDINPILQCYGALKQLVTDGTRKSAILEYIITDLQGLFHPPSCISPLEVDENKIGKNSDHNIIVLAPINLPHDGPKRKKKTIKTRPLPDSQIEKFGKFMTKHNWLEVFSAQDVNSKVANFHNTLMTNLDLYFPQKTIKVSSLDKKFMNPELKSLQRRV